jgi:NAD(P)-dependent dehydrogenase (short-subunit alcohol dehydrogenase family)
MSRIILITGTSAGFGKLIATTMAKEGHSVVAAMRNVTTKNAAAAAALNALPNIEVVEMDVTSTDAVNTAIENTIKKNGRIDVLVNNAGIGAVGFLEATSIEQMKSVFEVNLWGYMRTIQAVLPAMRRQGAGLIINISSSLGILSVPYMAPYVGTKYAIEGMTESLQYEIKKFGIEAVTVMPGPFPTEIAGKSLGPDRLEMLEAYGEAEMNRMQQFGGIMYSKIMEYQIDNQEVADAVKKVIDLKPGTRPSQTLVSRMAAGIEQEFADSKVAVRKEWMERSGFGDYR